MTSALNAMQIRGGAKELHSTETTEGKVVRIQPLNMELGN